jgi:outer membrane protein TolC
MKHILFIILLISNVGTILSQDTLLLFDCHRMAIEGHPTFKEKNLYLRSKEIKVDNLGTNWYPSLDLNGSYSWQNEVVSLPFGDFIPGLVIPEVPHSNTKITMDIRQTLYDGGLTKAGKDLEEASMLVNQQQVDVSLNNIKDQVNLVYFHILLLQEQEKTISLKLQVLEGNRTRVEAGVNHEILGKTELRLMQAEILRAEQQLAEIRISNASAIKMLGKLTYNSIPENIVLTAPDVSLGNEDEGLRPENILFDLQLKQLDASMKLVSKNRQPKAYVFGQLGYGNPALDFFRDEFRGYYIVGAGLQWNIWDWNKTGREKEDMLVRQEIIRLREAAFDESISVQQEEINAEIKKFEEAVQRDLEIVKLRSEITSVAASQHENGVITTSDYIRELNTETESRILLNMHEIQLEQAKIKYLTSKGII